MERIALLKGSEERLLLDLWLLLWERDVRSVSSEARIEASTLFHSVRPRLVTVKDLRVSVGIFVTGVILLVLIGVLRVANSVKLSKRISLDASSKPRERLRRGARRRTLRLVFELRLPHLLV